MIWPLLILVGCVGSEPPLPSGPVPPEVVVTPVEISWSEGITAAWVCDDSGALVHVMAVTPGCGDVLGVDVEFYQDGAFLGWSGLEWLRCDRDDVWSGSWWAADIGPDVCSEPWAVDVVALAYHVDGLRWTVAENPEVGR